MDTWKFFDITHREHILCNPMSPEKLEQLIRLLRLEPGSKIIDIAMGKAEFILRLVEEYGVEGIGVDLSPYCVADARKKQEARIPTAELEFLEMDGADYKPENPESFDLAACLGASWIYGGHQQTLAALMGMAAPGGWVIAGEPFWREEPTDAYLDATGMERGAFGTHADNAQAGHDLGLELMYTLVSSQDDWDRYEGLQWYSALEWANVNPEDPDVGEVLARVKKDRETYLKWGRRILGWAIYAFKKDG
ncbi:MAG: SAM-dependent methyltransferase [Anaerolineales bacterium]